MKKSGVNIVSVLIFVCSFFSVNVLAAPPAPIVKHEKIVAADGSGDFKTIADALASITDASDTNRYRITVKPGTYNEGVTMKSYVDIVGSGQENTVINYLDYAINIPNNSTLENISVRGMIEICAATIRNVTVRSGIISRCGNAKIYNSSIVFDTTGNSVGLELYGTNNLVLGCSIEINTLLSPGLSMGIASSPGVKISAGGVKIINTKINMKGAYGAYGIAGDDLEIINSDIYVESNNDEYGTIGVNGLGIRVENSVITAVTTNPLMNTTYGINAGQIIWNFNRPEPLQGTLEINNSMISGTTLGAHTDNTGAFRIGASQIKGGHNGIAGVDKVINCHDGNYNPIPNQ